MTSTINEKMSRIREERRLMIEQIDRLQEQADAAPGGIRLYRTHRVEQFRERAEEIESRLDRLERGEHPAFEDEVDTLYDALREINLLASTAFPQVMPV